MIEYLNQKIKYFGEIVGIESAAKIFINSLGYHKVYLIHEFLTHSEFSALPVFQILKNDILGRPDLIALVGNVIDFYEIKSSRVQCSDSIRKHQLEWANRHSEYKVVFLFLEIDFLTASEEKFAKLFIENTELKNLIDNQQKQISEYKIKIKKFEDDLQYLDFWKYDFLQHAKEAIAEISQKYSQDILDFKMNPDYRFADIRRLEKELQLKRAKLEDEKAELEKARAQFVTYIKESDTYTLRKRQIDSANRASQ